MQKKRLLTLSIYLALAAILVTGAFSRPAQASPQTASAGELISAVNALRASYGLEAYAIDGGLMSLAQAHSEYQASIETCTHTRADGSGPGAYGISAENVACGLNLAVNDAIYYQWSDTTHTTTMIGPDTGQVGAGVAVVNDVVYYTLAVKRLTGDFVYRAPAGSDTSASADQGQGQVAQDPAVSTDGTSTPNEDGSIAHIVQYGETAIQIAEKYGISLADLASMNNLDQSSPVIFENDVLIIRLAFTLTPFMTATYTPRPPTRTPMPTRTPRPTRTATLPHVPQATWTSTPEPLVRIPELDMLGAARPAVAYTFIAVSAVGLLVVLVTAFLPKRK